jgi:hypothetical protein
MTEPSVASRKRNVAIGTAVVLLSLAALAYYYFFVKVYRPSPDDIVKVIGKKVPIPEGFEETFKDFTGILLVDKNGNLTAITRNGSPIDLCGSGSETDKDGESSCELATSAHALVFYISGADGLGYCNASGSRRSCHKINRKWYYHSNDTGQIHHLCSGTCQ